ncbi:MAG: hypothetical protein WC295_14375 [Methanoregula sp.]|jgi:hypothetical protein
MNFARPTGERAGFKVIKWVFVSYRAPAGRGRLGVAIEPRH